MEKPPFTHFLKSLTIIIGKCIYKGSVSIQKHRVLVVFIVKLLFKPPTLEHVESTGQIDRISTFVNQVFLSILQ